MFSSSTLKIKDLSELLPLETSTQISALLWAWDRTLKHILFRGGETGVFGGTMREKHALMLTRQRSTHYSKKTHSRISDYWDFSMSIGVESGWRAAYFKTHECFLIVCHSRGRSKWNTGQSHEAHALYCPHTQDSSFPLKIQTLFLK